MKINFKNLDGHFIPASKHDWEKVGRLKSMSIYEVELKLIDERTSQMNKALHLWFREIAGVLNNSGFYIKELIKPEVYWTPETIKEILFKPILKAVLNKDSTTKIKKDELDQLIDTVVLAFSKRGVELPEFPCKNKF
jgi:hypothetical protein